MAEDDMTAVKTAVLYHNDADGFGAAYACWTRLKDAAVYIPVQYGQMVPEIPESVRELMIVDFSYDRATCEALAQMYLSIMIIDHHATAEVALAGLPYATFDMGKSGAVLTWERMWATERVPEILCYVQDRDLWRWDLPHSEAVNLYIEGMPRTFEVWDDFCLWSAREKGEAIKGFRDTQVERALRDVRWEKVAGYLVPVVNLTDNISEVGHRLCVDFPEAPFSVSYCDRANGSRSFSLRAVGDFDVSAVALKFGGGGHRHAAGFVLPGFYALWGGVVSDVVSGGE